MKMSLQPNLIYKSKIVFTTEKALLLKKSDSITGSGYNFKELVLQKPKKNARNFQAQIMASAQKHTKGIQALYIKC